MGTGKIVELLAPAKDYAHGCAAIDCGADALYVGAPAFGARAGRGRAGRRDRPAVRLRPPFRGQGLRHDEHARLRERTVRGRADRPRHVPGRSRRADRAGCRFSAYGSASDRVARLDADVQYGPGPRPLLVRGGLHEADRGTGGLARRNAADCRVPRPASRSKRSCMGRSAFATAAAAS